LGQGRKRERKQAESKEPQGFKDKILIVENFFGFFSFFLIKKKQKNQDKKMLPPALLVLFIF